MNKLEGAPLSPDYSRLLAVTRFIGSDQSESDEDRMNAVTTNAAYALLVFGSGSRINC